jgi:hypothetical protein
VDDKGKPLEPEKIIVLKRSFFKKDEQKQVRKFAYIRNWAIFIVQISNILKPNPSNSPIA